MSAAQEMADQLENGYPLDVLASELTSFPADIDNLILELRVRGHHDTAERFVGELHKRHVDARAQRDALIAAAADPETTARLGSVDLVDHVDEFRGDKKELAGVLDAVDAAFQRWVAFPTDFARWAAVGWVAHCHLLDAFESTPRLAVLSAEKGSGKTRTLEVIEQLVPGPLRTVNVSAAALFRKIGEENCTLLLDEADTYLSVAQAEKHEDLRGIVNAGHRRGAVAYRYVLQKGVSVVEYPCFAPVALAGIGDLPDTILDRAIVIQMKRRAPNEHVEPFRERIARQVLEPLCQSLLEIGQRNHDKMSRIYPEMPDGLTDRPADVWEPLVVIGDCAGEEWSRRLRLAAVELNRLRQEKDPSLGIRLLADCRQVFTDKGVDRLTTEDLLSLLQALDEAPWGDLRGKPLDARGLARRLRPYEVKPAKYRVGGRVGAKGYDRQDFYDAWERYLPPLPVSPPGQRPHGPQGPQTEGDTFDTDDREAAYQDEFDLDEAG